MKTLKIWIWVIALVMIIIVTLYFNNFYWKLTSINGLSESKTDWGTFGDYLSGIFGLFNMVLFAFLTWYIFKSEEERSKRLEAEQKRRNQRDLDFQKERSENELKVQRKILLTQIRLNLLKELDSGFGELANTNLDTLQTLKKLNLLNYQLLNIGIRKNYLFQGINESQLNKLGMELSIQLTFYRDACKKDNTDIMIEYYGNDFLKLIETKNSFTTLIEEFVFNDLDK